jgi:CheY-like chemotaxis protein
MASDKLVLLIEDDEDIVNLFSLTIELVKGYVLETIFDGAAGLKRVGRKPIPGLVLLDLHLPHVSGDRILKQIRAREGWKDVPVVIISAYPESAGKYMRGDPRLPRADQVFLKTDFSVDKLRSVLVQYR